MDQELERKQDPQVLVVPYDGQGHINPMFAFARILASKGIKVTFVVTHRVAKSADSLPRFSQIDVETISDGSEDGSVPESIEEYFRRLKSAASKDLQKLIDEKMKKSVDSIKAVVYDSTLPWVLEIAHKNNLPGASFFTQSCAVSAVFYHLRQGSLLKYPYDEEHDELALPCFPAKLEIRDLPYFAMFHDPNNALVKHLTDQFCNIDDMDWVLFNTFDSLESELVEWMRSQWAIKTVGPTFLLHNTIDEDSNNDQTISIHDQENEDHCKEWLDSKPCASVIYISFGSRASLRNEQMNELAHGLMTSNCNFLWVVGKSEVEKLPEDFASLTSENGLIVNWCRQTRVLAHRAVACFMTHCGWNSTLEALSYGIPLIAMGQRVDQTTNAKFIEDVWGVGVRVRADGEDKIVRRDEIVKCIEQVTRGGDNNNKRIELEENALKWKKLAHEAVGKRGSSARNIADFVEEVRKCSANVCLN